MECITGKDFITGEELTSKERKKCAIGAVAGIKDFMPNNISFSGKPGEVLDLFDFDDKVNTLNDLNDFKKDIQSEKENESKKKKLKKKRKRKKQKYKKEKK